MPELDSESNHRNYVLSFARGLSIAGFETADGYGL